MQTPLPSSNSRRSSRRAFLKTSAAVAGSWAGIQVLTEKTRAEAPKIIGQGDFRYEVVTGWGELDPAKFPVANCHEMVEDAQGRLILFQTNVKNNILIYDKGGKLLESWGTTYPGAHGMDIVNENGEEFLFLTDTKQGKVFKTTMKGDVVMELARPDLPQYADPSAKYAPTNVMPSIDGSFYVGDGYGSSWVMHYSYDGKLQNVFGGPGKGDANLNTPHGGIVDVRDGNNPTLMICSRTDNALKRFTLSGVHLETIPIPGMRVCQLAVRGDYMVAPHLEGLISVIDKDNRVASNPGGSAPVYGDDLKLGAITKDEAASPFVHPHGVWIDEEESVYIAQWNSGNTYPIKLKRVPS
ncbi:MAG: twin-arginine translocation signal domain-containing protein [Verrucomicrobiae bacterium]|nr:twin-arginine translocation signal domain-containing protein [Verrucomicrobiae bacterium]